jgi:hypothetical protein
VVAEEKGHLIVPRGAERRKCLHTKYRMRAAWDGARKTQSHKTADLLFPPLAGANGYSTYNALDRVRCIQIIAGPGK